MSVYKKISSFSFWFFSFLVFRPSNGFVIRLQICVQGAYLMKIDNPYLFGKMFRIISPDSVQSGRTYLANLGVLSGQETHMFSPVELYQGDQMSRVIVHISKNDDFNVKL